jgi:hypothetical protein
LRANDHGGTTVRYERIETGLSWQDYIILRMFRRWAAARDAEIRPLQSLIRLAGEMRLPFEIAVSLDSVFQLTEHCLGRRLEAECCCSRAMAADESAILALIAAVPPHSADPQSPAAIPHGLPGVLRWAICSARLTMGQPAQPPARASAKCPFRENRRDAPAGLRKVS